MITLSPAALRSSRLEVIGSGLGTDPDTELVASISEAFSVARQAGFKVKTRTASVQDVETAWSAEDGTRLVITL